jgi:hypothetical protein
MTEQDVITLITGDIYYIKLKEATEDILYNDFKMSSEFLSSLSPLEPIHKFGNFM